MNLKQHLRIILPALALLCCQEAAKALNCGDLVSGSVTLTADLNCSGPGLLVGAASTTIHLNGHTIACAGAGFAGSCQMTNGPVGIISSNHNNVQVLGPGTVSGFEVGVRLASGTGLLVQNVRVTGPPAADYTLNTRSLTVGIVIFSTACPRGNGASAQVLSNDVSNHTQGIQISSAHCVTVNNNNVHDNNGPNDSHGIDVIASSTNSITNNLVHANGINNHSDGSPDSGITLVGDSEKNLVQGNMVLNNCGNGIVLLNGPKGNAIQQNTARFNATALTGQCALLPLRQSFWDLAEANEGTGNTWNNNNLCRTEGAGIPAGVCHAGE